MSKTTILVESTTRELLKHIGRKDQTYDELINTLIKSRKNSQDSLDNRIASLRSSESINP
jgi:hypothetical protein